VLHAVGVDASFFDAIAVLIAVVTLSQLPVGPSVGAAAAVLILGSDGVAAAAAAGVLLTVTGTIGGLVFLAWGGADRLWCARRRGLARHTGQHVVEPPEASRSKPLPSVGSRASSRPLLAAVLSVMRRDKRTGRATPRRGRA